MINSATGLFSTLKVNALECVSVINQKCILRPKILDVNEGVGEALFYPYNGLVNKCSGNCNTLDNPMTKSCVPNVIKRVNMQVYNFLMRLNVLWHESCKCVCKLNSSVCNNKQIWNNDTCRCDCNEDFTDIINCNKGYMWNPSTCECQCDKWCKSGQYLDHKNCICKNKLIGKVIEECTSIINETMINNNKDNITNNNTYLILFIVFLIGFIMFLIGFIYYNIIIALDMVWSSIKDKINPGIKIKDYNKFRFNSDIDLPVNTIIEFRSLLINVSCIIEKDNEYYPEIYLDECSYVKTSI